MKLFKNIHFMRSFIALIITLTTLLCSLACYGWFANTYTGTENEGKISFGTAETAVPSGKYYIYYSDEDNEYDLERYDLMIASYDEQIVNKQAQIDACQAEITSKTNTKNSKTSQKNTLVNTTIPNTEASITAREGELATIEQNIVNKNNQITEANAQLSTLATQLNGVNNTINGYLADIQQCNDTIAYINSMVAALSEDDPEYEAKIQEAQDEIAYYQGEIANINNLLQPYYNQRDSITAQQTTINNQINGYNNDLVTLGNQKTAKQNQITSLNNELAGYNNNVDTLTAEISQLETEITNLNATLATYNSDKASLQEGKSGYVAKRAAIAAKASNMNVYKEYTFNDGSELANKILLEEADIVDLDGNPYTNQTHFDYLLERVQLGTIDNLGSLKADNHFYVRFYVEPTKHGNNMTLDLSYYSDDTVLIDKNKNLVTNAAALSVVNTENTDLLCFRYAVSANAYTPGTSDFNNNLDFDFFDPENPIQSTTNYYLYIDISPNLPEFTGIIEDLNLYMDCLLMFKVNIQMTSYTPGEDA